MVGTVGGAGNTLLIKGKFDTVELDNGFRRIKQDFKSTEGQAKSFTSDLVRMKTAAGGLAKTIIGAGAAGATFLTALASKAPAVAPAMAKIGVAVGKLSRGLGETLQPAFEGVARLMERVVAFEGAHPNLFAGILGTFTALAALKFAGLSGILIKLGTLAVSSSGLAALASLAAIAGTGLAVKGIVDALATQTLPGEAVNVPIPTAAREQIATAGPEEFNRLATRYGRDPFSIGGQGGAERTVEIDPNTGRLVTGLENITMHISDEDLFRYTRIAQQERDRRSGLMQWWDSVWG